MFSNLEGRRHDPWRRGRGAKLWAPCSRWRLRGSQFGARGWRRAGCHIGPVPHSSSSLLVASVEPVQLVLLGFFHLNSIYTVQCNSSLILDCVGSVGTLVYAELIQFDISLSYFYVFFCFARLCILSLGPMIIHLTHSLISWSFCHSITRIMNILWAIENPFLKLIYTALVPVYKSIMRIQADLLTQMRHTKRTLSYMV